MNEQTPPPPKPADQYAARDMLTARIGTDLFAEAVAFRLPGETLTDLTKAAIVGELANRRRFQRNGPFEPTVVRIVGRDKNQRLIVSDGGDLLTDGVDGEIVRGGE